MKRLHQSVGNRQKGIWNIASSSFGIESDPFLTISSFSENEVTDPESRVVDRRQADYTAVHRHHPAEGPGSPACYSLDGRKGVDCLAMSDQHRGSEEGERR